METIEKVWEVKDRWAKGTPGPWINLTDAYNEKMKEHRKATKRWWHGTENHSLAVVCIAQDNHHGDPITADSIPWRVDWYDLKLVIGYRWSQVAASLRKSGIMEGFFGPEDADKIAHAPQDIAFLLGEVERLSIELSQARGIKAVLLADVPAKMVKE